MRISAEVLTLAMRKDALDDLEILCAISHHPHQMSDKGQVGPDVRRLFSTNTIGIASYQKCYSNDQGRTCGQSNCIAALQDRQIRDVCHDLQCGLCCGYLQWSPPSRGIDRSDAGGLDAHKPDIIASVGVLLRAVFSPKMLRSRVEDEEDYKLLFDIASERARIPRNLL